MLLHKSIMPRIFPSKDSNALWPFIFSHKNDDLVDTEIPLVMRFVIYFFISASKSSHFGAYTGCPRRNGHKLRKSVPYVKIYRYNPKHLYPKLNGYGDNGHQKVWASGGSTYCTPSVTPYWSTAHARQRDIVMQWPWWMLYSTVALTSQDNGQLRPA